MTDIGIVKGKAQVPVFNNQYELWIIQNGQSPSAQIYVRNESNGPVVVTFESGPTNDPTALDPTAVTMNLDDRRHQKAQAIPVPATVATPPYYHYTRVRATGDIRAEVCSEIEVDCYTRKRPELE